MQRFLFAILALVAVGNVFAQEPTPTPEQVEFFEKKVRPVLVQHCYECHSTKSKKVRGELLVDSRAGLLRGGELGASIVPGNPEKSRLIEAIRYTNVDLKMPRNGKLPDAVIADLTAWIKMGAPWPSETIHKKNPIEVFDLQKRKAEHWCWQPVRVPKTPQVNDAGWARSDIDRFLLAKLEAKGLKPAPDTDARTLLRRLHFDIVGLPPSRSDSDAFDLAWQREPASRGDLIAQTADRLLASPQFGERWARHWLDLVRYAESRGHEFDYNIPNAYEYRDYVIRAINSDVPYDKFVHEHVAGDLLKHPRTTAVGSNESILGTAFWFLGEEIHSPVDIRQDQADRFDNRIDVMTKTFLGLTVACARCHDHKFDAISTKDYYALFGILESSNYRLARFDTIGHHRNIAEQLAGLRTKHRKTLLEKIVVASTEGANASKYLLAAIDQPGKDVNPAMLKRWQDALARATKDESSPLHAFARASAKRDRPVQETLDAIANIKAATLPMQDIVIDYRNMDAGQWLSDGVSYGIAPARAGDIILGTNPEHPIAQVVDIASARLDRTFDGLRISGQNESGSLGGLMRPGRTLRTPEFTLKHGRAFALLKGSGAIYAGVGQHIMLSGPLHGNLVQRFNSPDQYRWVPIDLMTYKGQRTHLEFTPNEKSDFAIVMVVQSLNAPAPIVPSPNRWLVEQITVAKSLDDLAKQTQTALGAIAKEMLADNSTADQAPLANWYVQNLDLFVDPNGDGAKELAKLAAPILEQQKTLLTQIKLDSRLIPAMQDGSGTDEFVFTRGNPKTPGALVQRRFLEAFNGPEPVKIAAGSGRLELARQMTDPAVTPLIARVYVNRIWHHLFGRGIVASVDNFGVLGDAPTHPELLDYLADRFVKESWSTKKLIRTIVQTRAYQMSSSPNAKAADVDPNNLLLHRMHLRRLEGEAIRDSILSVSGRLNPKMYGPSVLVHLTAFQQGRGHPGSGPVDGDGRRSVYLSVRRNFLSPFLLAFDTPSPFSTVGRRTVSNVPAQALILMNDPFVHDQAKLWAKRVLAENANTSARIRGMYLDAFGRPPTEAELRACSTYLGATPDVGRWGDLAHVLINAKEFYFLN